MTKTHLGFISLVVIILSFSACTVEKRVYQDGYHISWKHHLLLNKNADLTEVVKTEKSKSETVIPEKITESQIEPNVHSGETVSASNSEDIAIQPQKRTILQASKDTVIPGQSKPQEEYFSNTYTPPARPDELQDIKLANWALGLGIGAVSAPVWGLVLFLILAALLSASSSSFSIWAAFGFAFLLAGSLFIAMEVLAIIFAIRFLKLHAKDPNYTKYRKRAITALILAGIYPAIIILNIFIGLAMI